MDNHGYFSLLTQQAKRSYYVIRLEGRMRNEVGKISDFLRAAYDLQYSYIRQHDEEGITFFLQIELPQIKEIFTNEYAQGKWNHHDGCDFFILK